MHDRLHPTLARILDDQGWQGLTQAQEQAFTPILEGKHALLVAPTGHGKTEASLLPVLSRLLAERDALQRQKRPWPQGFKVLYITPLRALNRDLLQRLQSWSSTLGLRLAVRHGDTTATERAKQSRDPPDILITTPETVQLLLYGDTLRRHLATVRFVIVDEVHDLAVSERGAQLLVALERIEEVIAQPLALREAKAPERAGPHKAQARPGGGFQRIGVSATIADPHQIARWLGGRDRPVEVIVVKAAKRLALTVAYPNPDPDDAALAARLSVPLDFMARLQAIRVLARQHERLLVFTNTRDGAELLASRGALLDEAEGRPALLGLHHGSLSTEVRQDTEDRFKSGELRALVATSSLELGIDIGAIDHIVQVGSPRSVARLVQRLGRSGHRVGATSSGTLLATGPEDALECAAVAQRAMEGRLEPLAIRSDPLVVLANQLIAVANEYNGLRKEWVRSVFGRAGCFLDLDESTFDAAWHALVESGTVAMTRRDTLDRSGRARRHFLGHISLIPDERTYRVLDEASKRTVGTVDDAFVAAAMTPGSVLVMAGRSWRVVRVEQEERRVRVAPVAELGPVPQWSGQQLPVSHEVARETARLRGTIVAQRPERMQDSAWSAAVAPVQKQRDADLEVPTDRVVTIEVSRRNAIANVALGTRGNEALARITAALLHQRLGAAVGIESDAYRIHFTLPQATPAQAVVDVWTSLLPDGIDLLLGLVLRDSPLVRHHLVHVARHFGALPPAVDATALTRNRLDTLLGDPALSEETLSRLLHDRMDVDAVTTFLRGLQDKTIRLVVQAQGPVSFLGRDEARGLVASPRSDQAMLDAVRQRIEQSDVLLACASCGNSWSLRVADLPKALRCRRCASNQIACLRPWHADNVSLLRRKNVGEMTPDERHERDRMHRNAALVSSFGATACRCLVGRGVGPDTATRILQKVADSNQPAFWREILQAELTFARTSAYWAT